MHSQLRAALLSLQSRAASIRPNRLARALGSFSAVAVVLLGTGVPANAQSYTPVFRTAPGRALGLVQDTSQNLARVPAHARMSAETVLPPTADLSANVPPIGDQGQEGSCVAWSTGYYYASYQEGLERKWDLKDPAHQFSAAWLYNQINGGGDFGAYPSDAFNLMQQKGIASLSAMPYRAGDYRTQPTASQTQDALPYTVSSWAYFNIGDVAGMKAHLAGGDLVSLSVPVYENFMWPTNPCSVPIGTPVGRMLGGHQITLVGYDDAKQAFRFANSWGTGWGCSGYAWLSYDFVSKNASNGYDMIGKTDSLGIVGGQVTDATTHAGIPAAQVAVGGYTIASDSAGFFALAVPAGSQTVTVTATGHTAISQVTVVSAGIVSSVNPALMPQGQGILSGTVTEASSHSAIVGARVTVGTSSATSSPTGAYTLAVPVGPQTVKVTAAGYVDWSQAMSLTTAPSTLNAGLVQALGTVTGRVTDATSHSAIAGAKVIVGSRNATSGPTGVYSIAAPIGPQTVSVTAVGYTDWSQAATVATGVTTMLNPGLVVKAQGTIMGKIIDGSTRAPIAGAKVTVGSLSTMTNAAGTFSFVVPSGMTTIIFSATGYTSSASYVNMLPGHTISAVPALFKAR